jgi:hypothetical protein
MVTNWFFEYKYPLPTLKEIEEHNKKSNIKIVPPYLLQPKGIPIKIQFPKELNYTIKNLPILDFPNFYSLIVSWIVWKKEGNWEKMELSFSLLEPSFVVLENLTNDEKLTYKDLLYETLAKLDKFAQNLNTNLYFEKKENGFYKIKLT